MKVCFLGIDIGTSACKLAVFGADGTLYEHVVENYPIHHPHPGYVEQDPADWWQSVCLGLKALWEQGADPASIAAVGIDGQGWSAIPLDRDGNVLARTPIWMDTRAERVCREWEARIGAERLFAVSGNPFSPGYTLPKVLFWKEHIPALFTRIRHILQSNSYIAYRLTGAISQDLSMCYGWQNFNIRTLRYDDALTAELGIPKHLLIDPVACDTVVGRVHWQAARDCGLLEGTPVVAGGLDAACGTLGAGVVSPGQTQEQGGQAGGMSICTERPVAHPKLILGTHVVPGLWLLQGGTVGGGASLKWFAKELGAAKPAEPALARTGKDIFELLSAEAETSPPGANGLLYLPYMSGERSPLWDTKAQGVYFGLGFDKTHADLVRATMEGVAFALRHNLETAAQAGATVKELRGMGGSANSRIWTQIKADVTGIPMVIPASDTATTCGAAMLAMVGVGQYRDYREATDAIVKVQRVQYPDAGNTAQYRRYFDLYQSLYACSKDCMARLYDLKA